MKHQLLIAAILCSLSLPLAAQLTLRQDIPFIAFGDTLSAAMAGGLNQAQFSNIELNGDSVPDLAVFDRSGNKVLTFVHPGDSGSTRWRYAPQYEAAFPPLRDWMLLRDYDGDGRADLFSAAGSGNDIAVWQNTGSPGNPVFSLRSARLSDRINNWALSVPSGDLPAIDDLDGDGDLDVLCFDSGGFQVLWYRNMSYELTGRLDSLVFETGSSCWGEFQEGGLDNTVTLGVACKGVTGSIGGAAARVLHAGSALCSFDADGDGDKELLLGDLSANNIVFLENGGTAADALMTAVSYAYPPAAPADVAVFPAAFYVDVNHDGQSDLVVAPNPPNISANFRQLLWYSDQDPGPAVNWRYEGREFLQSEMVDCGQQAMPVFFDADGDGLSDIVVGNFSYKTTNTDDAGTLTLFRNVGTSIAPAFELVTRDWLNLRTVFSPLQYNLAPAFGDLDGDGDADLLLGVSNGTMHRFENTAGPGNPSNFRLLNLSMFGIDVGQMATPCIHDINGDGLPDLVVGEALGNFNLYLNKGSATQAQFDVIPDDDFWGGVDVLPGIGGNSAPRIIYNPNGERELLAGCEQGRIIHYGGLQNATFTTLDTVWGGIRAGSRTYPDAADLDGDGLLEVVVGNQRGGIAIYSSKLPIYTSLNQPKAPAPAFSWHAVAQTLYVQFAAPQPGARLRLFSMNGALLSSHEAQPEETQIPIEKLPRGAYLIELQSPGAPPQYAKWIR